MKRRWHLRDGLPNRINSLCKSRVSVRCNSTPRGQGVAAILVEAAFAAAREAGVKIEPQCSYIARYMERHPETSDLRV